MFHWFTAILVLFAFIYAPGGSELRVYMPQRDFDRQPHETLGRCNSAQGFYYSKALPAQAFSDLLYASSRSR